MMKTTVIDGLRFLVELIPSVSYYNAWKCAEGFWLPGSGAKKGTNFSHDQFLLWCVTFYEWNFVYDLSCVAQRYLFFMILLCHSPYTGF